MTDLVVLSEQKRYSSCERHKLNLRGGYVQLQHHLAETLCSQ